MKITMKLLGIIIAVLIAAANIAFFSRTKAFYFIFGVAAIAGVLPYLLSLTVEIGRAKEKETMFLEFTRSLVESVKAGIPISRSIIAIRDKDFGSLTPHVKKLANQITIGIPVREAMQAFARDTKNKVVTRSVALITEAEESGGKIDDILESVAKSVHEVEDIKKERKSETYNFVMQGYLIYIIFLIIMLVMQHAFIPQFVQRIPALGGGFGLMPGAAPGTVGAIPIEALGNLFLWLIIVQGFFTGLVTGKLSEGSTKAGIKHSIILVSMAYLISTGIAALI